MKSIFYKFILFNSFTIFAFANVMAQKDVPVTGNITVVIAVDDNCNKTIEKGEYGNSIYTATLSGNGINRTASGFPGQTAAFSNVPKGNYSVAVSCSYAKNNNVQNLSTTLSASVNDANGAYLEAKLFPNCDVAPPPPPPPPPVELKCGQWREAYLSASPSLNLSGNADMRNRGSVIISTLKTVVYINLDYVSAPITEEGKKDVVKRCLVNGSIKYPNGSVTNFTNDHNFEIRAPGTYVITYEVRCGKEICASGSKVIVCNDPIVCNCSAPNDNLRINGAEGSANNMFKTGQAIIIDKAAKTSLFKTVNCEGNICDGYADFKVVDALGKVWDGGRANGMRYRFTAPNTGNYTLIVTDVCGNKTCNTYSYPISFKNEDKNEYYHKTVRSRWGIQVGYYRGFPKMERTTSTKGYGTGLIGLIADLPMGYARRFHYWPQFNIHGTNYRSTATQNVSATPYQVGINNNSFMFEWQNDISYAIPLKKDMLLHLYVGGGINWYLNPCIKYTSSNAAAITAWKAGNTSVDSVNIPGKFTAGLLLDINRNWVVGLNYYSMSAQKNKEILSYVKDRGVGIRVAYFFDKRRK